METKTQSKASKNDLGHDIQTNHYPLIAHIKVKFKIQTNATKQEDQPIKYKACTPQQHQKYNNNLTHLSELTDIINQTTQAHIPQTEQKPKQDYISALTQENQNVIRR